MEINNNIAQIKDAVIAIKDALLQTRYNIMQHANKEMLALYYSVGEYLSHRTVETGWGGKVLESISKQLQQEMPGLRGFSGMSLKKMRRFYEEWQSIFGSLSKPKIQVNNIRCPFIASDKINQIPIGSLSTTQLDQQALEDFLTVQFTHHYEILLNTNTIEERLFYIHRIATEFWSVEKLRYNLKEHLYEREGTIPNNFDRTLSEPDYRIKATKAFRKNYKLDFIEIEDPDEWDEHRVENSIVSNIKNFIMALGFDFSFMGNQYRLIIDEQEYFIDLLFYNRRLKSLVAIELKWTDFKPEYVGKMNFYLSALDDMVKLPDENPSIGIILCRGQKQKTVEYALRDTNKPMGVATYRGANELPKEYEKNLKLLDGLKDLI